MRRRAGILLLLVVTGFILLMLPDNGRRVVEFNESHGPSVADLAGLLLILTGWGYSLYLTIRNWKRINAHVARQNVFLLLLLYFGSLVLIAISLFLFNDLLLWCAIAVASMVNITFTFLAITTNKK